MTADSVPDVMPSQRRGWIALACVIVTGELALLAALGWRDLTSSHEARAAQHAQQMLDQGHWLLPRLFDERVDLQKPPLYYWLVAGNAWLRGVPVDAIAVRLPAALARIVTLLLVLTLFAASGRTRAGLIAVVLLATAQHFTWLGLVGRIDMPLACCVTAVLVGARLGGAWLALAPLAVAAGLLLKGPVAAVIPLLVLGVWCVVERQRPRLGLTLGVGLLAVALAAPWFVWANHTTHGELVRVFFWYHHLDRALGRSEALASYPWWYYLPRLFLDGIPWSPLLVGLLVSPTVRGWLRDDSLARFGLVWAVVVLAFLSCVSFKRADYLLPAYPGAVIALACVIDRWAERIQCRKHERWFLPIDRWSGAVVVMSVAAWLGYLTGPGSLPDPARAFAAEVRRHLPAPGEVLFFRLEHHPLSLYLGRRQNTFMEWENLDVWAGRAGTHYILMPEACAAAWADHVTSGRLIELARARLDRPDHPGRRGDTVVLMRTEAGSIDDDDQRTGPRGRPVDQRADPRLQSGGEPEAGRDRLGALPHRAAPADRTALDR